MNDILKESAAKTGTSPAQPFADMRDFMHVLGDELPFIGYAQGQVSPQALRYLNLCKEELDELHDAYDLPTRNLQEVMAKYAAIGDGAIDLIVVAIGVLHSFGLPADAIWREVHRSNMRKRDPNTGVVIRRSFDNKILKPEGWQPPNIVKIIAEAVHCGPHSHY